MTEKVPLSDFVDYAVYKGEDIKILAREVATDIFSIKLFYSYEEDDEIECDGFEDAIADEEHYVRRKTLIKLFEHYKVPKATHEEEWVLEETGEYVSI